jgi:tRNA nucleotidyltransferase (CCA-adding enzyme)
MDLIVTHINADFDGLSSLVAGKKLYPHARLLLPGSQEKAVREFLSLSQDIIRIESERECRLDDVNRLIIMDTRLATRIGIAAGLLTKAGLEIHIYDHHPRTPQDIRAAQDTYKEVGATVTMLADIIRKNRIKLSPLEATMMALGIYEETGSLTYRTTTKKDVDIISFLLSKGANLNVVASYLNRELSKEELAFLVNLMHSTETFDINGVDIGVATCEATEYGGELSTMVHKLVDVENFKVLFLLAQTNAVIRLIARSRIPSVDVNKILKGFGGGGHPAASSASIRNEGMSAIKEKLLKVLKRDVRAKNTASDIMNADIKNFSPDQKIDFVKRNLEKARLECGIVRDGKQLKGIVTIQAIEKAMEKNLAHLKVKSIMSSKFFGVRPDTPISQIQKLIFEKKVGNILVMQNQRPIGIVTRTNVLKAVHAGLFSELPKEEGLSHSGPINISRKIKGLLPKKLLRLIKLIDNIAHENDCHAFLVGGFVRDILLGVKNLDLDIVVEGETINVVKALVARTGGSFIRHKRFGTATAVLPWPVKLKHGRINKVKIDFATARKECYEKPAALPTVEFSTVKEDLSRRDFTINAMAVVISTRNFGQLIDFFGGQKDLAHKRIRVLHEASFIDDPTRIFRAVRFEQRFNFRIEPHTERLIREALKRKMLDKTEKQRLRDELMLILNEDEPKKMLRRMETLGELKFIHPRLHFTKKTERFFDEIRETISWFRLAYFHKRSIDGWLIYLIALLSALSKDEIKKVCEGFVFKHSERLRLLSYKTDGPKISSFLKRPGKIPPSQIYRRLEPLSYEVILAIMAKSQSRLAKKRIADFLTRDNGAKLQIKGRDLEAMGLKAGPGFKKILTAALYAKLDKGFVTKRQELDFVKRAISYGSRGLKN